LRNSLEIRIVGKGKPPFFRGGLKTPLKRETPQKKGAPSKMGENFLITPIKREFVSRLFFQENSLSLGGDGHFGTFSKEVFFLKGPREALLPFLSYPREKQLWVNPHGPWSPLGVDLFSGGRNAS